MTSHGTPKGLLLAAIGFDEASDAVIRTAYSMAKAFDMRVHLLHVVEPPLHEPVSLEMPAYYTIPPLVRAAEEEMIKERKASLAALVAKLGGPDHKVTATGEVLSGDSTRLIISEAIGRRANLILTACNPDAYKLMPSGFSTALTLMHDAPVPVLVVNSKTDLDFSKAGLSLLLADDLSDTSREAACKAYELAARLQKPKVRHVHVHGDFREIARDTWLDLINRTPALKALGKTPEALWTDEYQARMAKLGTQGQPFRAKAEAAGTRVEFDVRTGGVHKEIDNAIKDAHPDLLVFGRHRAMRSRPFLIGRMSFKAMIHDRLPVLLVPPAKELHSRLPFPSAAE